MYKTLKTSFEWYKCKSVFTSSTKKLATSLHFFASYLLENDKYKSKHYVDLVPKNFLKYQHPEKTYIFIQRPFKNT